MNMTKKRLFAAIFIAIGFILAGCGETEEQKETIVFADEGWDSVRFHNEIAGIILEAGYGFSTEQTAGSSAPIWQGLEQGDIDVHMEGWTENLGEIYTKALDSGNVEELTVNFDDNYQGFYVPTYVIEGDEERGIEPMAPDLKYITDLPEYQELFQDPDDPAKGRIIGAISGWSVDEMLQEAVEDYEIDETFNYMAPGSEAAINTSLVDAYENGEPWVGYNYEPNWIMGQYDMTPLEEEDPDGLISQIASQDITIAINVDLRESAPEVVEFLENYYTTSDIASEALSYIQEEEASAHDAAVKFLQENEDLWTDWVPEDVVEKVKENIH
jgi:glycine betaine/proline transport system substrate-binding protein